MNSGLKLNRESPETVLSDGTAKELAKLAGETYDTIGHWAGERLLPYSKKGRTRRFPLTNSLARCKRILELQNEDFNLAAIRHPLNKRG